MILWSNGTSTRPGVTLAVGLYERTERTADRKSCVLVKRTWVDVWTGTEVERLLEHDSGFTRAEVDATPNVVALAETWRADEAYREERRNEAIQKCRPESGQLSLVCFQPWRGCVYRYHGQRDITTTLKSAGKFYAEYAIDSYYSGAEANAIFRSLTNIPLDLIEVTGLAEGDRPAWAMPITWLANKNRVLGYLAMKRMATEPEFLARVEAHGRLLLDMDGQRPPGSWAKQNNRIFGLEPST